MAIDTEDKRRSVVALGMLLGIPCMLPVPDDGGVDSTDERQTCAGVYNGLTSSPYIPGVYGGAYGG